MDEIFCQRPDIYRPWSEHQEVRLLFTEEHPSGRAYQPSLPRWRINFEYEMSSKWTRVYLVCANLPSPVVWEPFDTKGKLQEVVKKFLKEVLPGYREGTKAAMVRSYIKKLAEALPSEVLLEDQWIPRPHGFKRILMLNRQLEVGPSNALGLRPIHGEQGCALRLARFGLLSCVSVREGLERLKPVSSNPKFMCGSVDAFRRRLTRMNPIIQMTAWDER